MQDPVVLGAQRNVCTGFSYYNQRQLIQRKIEDGFNDPRRLTVVTCRYPDGETPTHDRTRTFGLTTALDTAPKHVVLTLTMTEQVRQ